MRDAFSHFARPFLWPYLIFGGCTVVSGVILFLIPFLQRNKPSDHKVETDCEDYHLEKELSSLEKRQEV